MNERMKTVTVLRSDLGKARGIGPSHGGTEHWWMQRLTAIALLPLVIWFFVFMYLVYDTTIMRLVLVFASPIHAILAIAFMVTSMYHGALGMKVIIEDYVHLLPVKNALIAFVELLSSITVIAGVVTMIYFHINNQFIKQSFQQVIDSTPVSMLLYIFY